MRQLLICRRLEPRRERLHVDVQQRARAPVVAAVGHPLAVGALARVEAVVRELKGVMQTPAGVEVEEPQRDAQIVVGAEARREDVRAPGALEGVQEGPQAGPTVLWEQDWRVFLPGLEVPGPVCVRAVQGASIPCEPVTVPVGDYRDSVRKFVEELRGRELRMASFEQLEPAKGGRGEYLEVIVAAILETTGEIIPQKLDVVVFRHNPVRDN